MRVFCFLLLDVVVLLLLISAVGEAFRSRCPRGGASPGSPGRTWWTRGVVGHD